MSQLQTDQPVARPDLREVEREIEERRQLHESSIAAAQRRLQELELRSRVAAERLRLAQVAGPEAQEAEVDEPVDRCAEDAAPAPEDSLLEINEVTAEELHLEGLTVMQALRFIAQRDRIGGFGTLDDVEQIEGIPYDTLLDLKRRSAV